MLDLFARDPDIFTFHAARELLPERLARAIVRESRLARLPGMRQRGHDPGRWRWLLPYMPRYFERLDLSGYELVVSSSHACAAGVRPLREALHVCYCHTPMRYVWMPDAERDRATGVKGAALTAFRGRLRRLGPARRAAAGRLRGQLDGGGGADRALLRPRGAVVPPPVAIEDFPRDVERDAGHFLWVHRLVPYKRPLEVAEAFRGCRDLRLTMVGVGPLEDELRAALPPNVRAARVDPRETSWRGCSRAPAGFIHVGEEDFGISMVEALAAGTPGAGRRPRRRARHRAPRAGRRADLRRGDPDAIRAACASWPGAHWDADALRQSARALLGGALPRALRRGAPRSRRELV